MRKQYPNPNKNVILRLFFGDVRSIFGIVFIRRISARFDHLWDYIIELGCILTCNSRSAESYFQIATGVAHDRAASISNALVSFKTFWLLLLREFAGIHLGKLVKR